MANLSPWEKIMRNAKNGKGLVLSADEVFRLSLDGAIETRAALDAEERAQSDAEAKL